MTEEGPGPDGPALGLEELAAVAALWRKSGRELRARFGGSSMEPTLPPDAELLLRCGAPASAGDVVAFLSRGGVIVHRVEACSQKGGWVLTRGDARALPDVPIRDPEAILGRVVGIRRGPAFVEVPPAPASRLRRAALWPLLIALRVSPTWGSAAIALLLLARRRLLSLRRVLASRLRGGSAARGDPSRGGTTPPTRR